MPFAVHDGAALAGAASGVTGTVQEAPSSAASTTAASCVAVPWCPLQAAPTHTTIQTALIEPIVYRDRMASVRAFAWMCLLAACYGPTPPEGAACGSGGSCPSELTCKAGVCVRDHGVSPDAPVIDGPVIDGPRIDARLVDAPPDASMGLVCPSGYMAVTGQTSKYRVVTTPVGWAAAELDCENDGSGTHLAVIDNATEDAAVDALTGASIWFGLTDIKVEGQPRWVTGALPVYTNYGTMQNTAAYDCAGVYQGKWAWGDCTTLIKYVCECDGIAADPNAY